MEEDVEPTGEGPGEEEAKHKHEVEVLEAVYVAGKRFERVRVNGQRYVRESILEELIALVLCPTPPSPANPTTEIPPTIELTPRENTEEEEEEEEEGELHKDEHGKEADEEKSTAETKAEEGNREPKTPVAAAGRWALDEIPEADEEVPQDRRAETERELRESMRRHARHRHRLERERNLMMRELQRVGGMPTQPLPPPPPAPSPLRQSLQPTAKNMGVSLWGDRRCDPASQSACIEEELKQMDSSTVF